MTRLRDAMPITAALVDDLRETFGREEIDAQIRRGLQGIPGFWAREGGREIGTRFPEPVNFVTAEQMVIERPKEDPKGRRP